MKVLLVDDEPWSIQGLIASLESRGVDCVVATDMAAGVKALQGNDISVVVTDVMMPPDQSQSRVDASESGFHLIEYLNKTVRQNSLSCASRS